jgi:hypothetical protein
MHYIQNVIRVCGMAYSIRVKEITQNFPLKEVDIREMAFVVKQTFHRYLTLINAGYLEMEAHFLEEEGDTVARQFDSTNPDIIRYADTSLYHELMRIYKFCFTDIDKEAFISADENKYMFNGLTMGGLFDFLSETMAPCLSYQSLDEHGILDDYYDGSKIHRLFIAFFAHLKLHFGSLEEKDGCPDVYGHIEGLHALGIHLQHFSFRELTLLSGYKTERAVRNLASPSTPEHRRISVVKEGRNTYVTHSEALRWLAGTGRI